MQLRNIGMVAHVDAGKTTTTEEMLFQSGRLKRSGRVDDGTAHTDYLGIEKTRGISVRAAVTRLLWKDCTVNLIDTPGHVDFSAEVERALRVLDGVILVVSAVDGVQAHTETLWHALQAMNIPTLIYVNKVDRIGVNLRNIVEEMQRVLHPSIVPIQKVDAEGPDFSQVTSIFSPVGDELSGDEGHLSERELSGAKGLRADEGLSAEQELRHCHAVLAETCEDLLESFVEGNLPPTETLHYHLRNEAQRGRVFPVLFGASLKGIGVKELLDGVLDYIPQPKGSSLDELSGIVFQIERDKSQGRVAYVRLFTGQMENRDMVRNVTQGISQKVNQIRQIDVQMYRDTGVLSAGDVGAVYGLSQARIGDVLGNAGAIPRAEALSVPLLTVQVIPRLEQDYQRLAEALQELDAEDPSLRVQWLPDERELHIHVMGAIQLEVLHVVVRERFGIDVEFSPPSVVYRETPKRAAEGFVAYTMPKPCWAILRFLIEPLPRGSGLQYSSFVRTEKLLQSYQNEVERRVPDALQQGLYGFEVTDLKVTLMEGEHHIWHTHPLDFVVATPMGIMDGLQNAGTALLEPILEYRLSVPEEFGGRVLSDLSQMRGDFDNPVVANGRFTVEGTIPLATSIEYPIQLGILTGGRGTFATRFLEYRLCPEDVKATRTRRGVNPLDTSKYILWVRNALSQ